MHLFATHFGTYEVVNDTAGAPTLHPFRLDRDPSPVGAAFLDLAAAPERIRQPMARRGWLERRRAGDTARGSDGRRGFDEFVPLDWPEAIDLVAGEIDRIRTDYGNASIFGGSYGWASAGRFHHAQSQLKRFLNLAGGFTTSVNTYSYGTGGVVVPHIIGQEYADAGATSPTWDQVAANAKVMLAFGGFRVTNAQVQAGGIGVHTSRQWLHRTGAAGVRIIVVSPTRSDVPEGLDAEFVPIRPNTDAALLLGMAATLLEAGRVDLPFLERCTVGHETFFAYLRGKIDGIVKTAEWASAICGVPAEKIRELAFALADLPSLITASWSLQRARFGEQPYWATVALAAMAGHVGQPGCGFAFGLISVNSIGQPTRSIHGPAVPQGVNKVGHYIPVAQITPLLLGEKTLDYNGKVLELPDIRLVYWAGGNPYHHHQNLNRLAEAWQCPDTVVVNDSVWTGTARFADIVLPTTLPFERDDVAACSRDNWIVASRQVLPPPCGVRTDHEIFTMLADRLGFADRFTEGRSASEWIERLYEGYRKAQPELPAFADFWTLGYAALDPGEDAPFSETVVEHFVADPVGHPLSTPSGRIEIFSETVAGFGYDDCPGYPVWREPEEWLGAPLAERLPLHLLTPQPAKRLHSQLEAAGPSRSARVAGHEAVLIHPADAAARGIADGEVVTVFNDRGRCLAGAVVSYLVEPGVVVMATGAVYDPSPDDPRLERSGNPNALTSDRPSSRLSQGCAPNSCLVEIERIAS